MKKLNELWEEKLPTQTIEIPKSNKELSATELRVKLNKADKALGEVYGNTNSELPDDIKDLPVSTALVYKEPEVALITKEQLKKVFPKKVNNQVLERCVEVINESITDMDSVFKEHFRDNVIGLIDVLKDTRVKFEDYLKAVQFCSYKMAGNTDTRSYALTFPDRVARMQAEKVPMSYLSIYASTYAKNKIVVDVLAKMLVPTHIMFQDYFHLAVKTQVEIMTDNNVSPKVRSDAANSLMTHLKQPEIKQAELKIKTEESSVIDELRDVLGNLAKTQRKGILEGEYSITDVSAMEIINERNQD